MYGIEEKRYLVLLAHMLGAQFTSSMRAVNTHLLVRPPPPSRRRWKYDRGKCLLPHLLKSHLAVPAT